MPRPTFQLVVIGSCKSVTYASLLTNTPTWEPCWAASARLQSRPKSRLPFSGFHKLLERGNRRQTLVDGLMRYVSKQRREAQAEKYATESSGGAALAARHQD